MRLRIRYRGHWLELDFSCDRLKVVAPDGWAGPNKILVRDTMYEFHAGEPLELPCGMEHGGWRPPAAGEGA
jgi:hypothetical protein